MHTASAICQVPLGFYGTFFKHLPLLGQLSLNSLNSNEHDKEVCIAGCYFRIGGALEGFFLGKRYLQESIANL